MSFNGGRLSEEQMLLCDDAPDVLRHAINLEAVEDRTPKPEYADRAKSEGQDLWLGIKEHARTFPAAFRGSGTRENWSDNKGFNTIWLCSKDGGEILCR
jgi:hypothetical protein